MLTTHAIQTRGETNYPINEDDIPRLPQYENAVLLASILGGCVAGYAWTKHYTNKTSAQVVGSLGGGLFGWFALTTVVTLLG